MKSKFRGVSPPAVLAALVLAAGILDSPAALRTDRSGRPNGNGHGQLHGHSTGQNVLQRLPQYRPKTDQKPDETDQA